LFERALEIEPRSLDALTGTVAVDVAQGRTAQARARVDSYVARLPDNPALLVMAARLYIADRDYLRAEDALQRVVQRQPENLTAYTLLGQLYMSQNKLDAARARFEEIAKRQPASVGADVVVAMILQAQDKPQEAQKRYERILERDPEAAAAANNLAWLYAQAGVELDRALKLAQTAYRRLPEDAQVRHTLGWVYYKQHLPALAISHFAYSVEKDPANPMYHYHLGLAYLESGERNKARAALQRALDVSPGFPQASEARAALARLSI
jgi:tetratricopeptide (TPR) repeat protein